MTGLLSIYLDILRFLAAVGVFLSHAERYPFSAGVLPHIYFSHLLVIVFFVISGYVIAVSVDKPDRSFDKYGADRLARLSSVVIPALILTYALDWIGSLSMPEIYAGLNPHWQLIRFTVNLFYCQQIWWFCVPPSSNGPFWSLGYEFWYYVLFGIWLFAVSGRVKFLLVMAVALFIGPKIFLLLPAWVVGVLAYHAAKSWRLSFISSLAWFICTGLIAIIALTFPEQFGLDNGKAGAPPLYYSANFVGDNIFALIIGAHFLFCAVFSRHLITNLDTFRTVKVIRWAAGHTFSLYVYHTPILWFLRAITKFDPHNLWDVLAAMALTLLIIVGLSKVTEERHLALRSFLRKHFGAWAVKWRARKAPVEIAPDIGKELAS